MLRSEKTWPATAEHVREARRQVTELARRAGVPEEALPPIRLAVSEATSNAIVHGYRDDPRGEFTVVAQAEDHRLEVSVRDRGCGISPHLGGRGAGLGLPLIGECADSFAVRPNADGDGTEVRMTFRLPVGVHC